MELQEYIKSNSTKTLLMFYVGMENFGVLEIYRYGKMGIEVIASSSNKNPTYLAR
jgi:hypothetical protein